MNRRQVASSEILFEKNADFNKWVNVEHVQDEAVIGPEPEAFEESVPCGAEQTHFHVRRHWRYFFSLPDESGTSEDEAESSDDEFVPELAPRDSCGDEDEPGPSTGKRKRR
ncbi:hypothetical protein MRX96_051927 [Rhipicephalus microplus]